MNISQYQLPVCLINQNRKYLQFWQQKMKTQIYPTEKQWLSSLGKKKKKKRTKEAI